MGIPTGWELILLLGVLVLLFGSTKLPAAARSIGQSMRIFKAETKSLRSDRSDEEDTAPAAGQPGTSPSQQAAPPARPAPQPAPPPQQALPSSAVRAATPIEESQRGSDPNR